jgi:hypothetical protein
MLQHISFCSKERRQPKKKKTEEHERGGVRQGKDGEPHEAGKREHTHRVGEGHRGLEKKECTLAEKTLTPLCC